jgi:hypothetical protein
MVVKDIPGLIGEYEADWDIERITTNEWHLIKRLSGVRFSEYLGALKAMDTDLMLALEVIFFMRAGVDGGAVEHILGDLPPFSNRIEFVETEADKEAARKAEADARPPDSPTPSGDESSPVESESVVEPSTSLLASSSNGGGHLESVPTPTGSPPSDTGAESVPAISGP